jgi:hypothetical protein
VCPAVTAVTVYQALTYCPAVTGIGTEKFWLPRLAVLVRVVAVNLVPSEVRCWPMGVSA